jgi:ribosomal protein S6--L-glutamate ligase
MGAAMNEPIYERERGQRVAIGRQLCRCPAVITLGARANLCDYSDREMALIKDAAKVYFPTFLFVEAMDALGKATFPCVHSYRHLGDKIKQLHLFQFNDLPMPNTRLYYGPQKQERILDDFSYPFVAKVPRGSSQGEGVFLIRDSVALQTYLKRVRVAYIQAFVSKTRDIRVVILGRRIVLAYWLEATPGEFRTNLARGGRVMPDPVPREALSLALSIADRCGFDHAGIDLCPDRGRFLVLEANISFGREGLRAFGMRYDEILRSMVESGEI